MNDLLQQLGTTFGWLSLLQFGGSNAILPEMHRQAVDIFHWMDGHTFARLFALAQLAPGPNIMIVSLIGWQVANFPGLVVATVAVLAPPCGLAFVVSRLMLHPGLSRWLAIVKEGLLPIAIGMTLASGAIMVEAAHSGPLGIAITVAATAVVAFTNFNLLWPLVASIAIGLVAQQVGL
jgi:chromate transporter